MKTPTRILVGLVACTLLSAGIAAAEEKAAPPEKAAPTVADQMHGLQTMCAESAAAREARQAEKSLYERLGGYDRILALTTEVVRLHHENEAIKGMLENVDGEVLARHVADFMAVQAGGDVEYTGRTLPASHGHLHLTDADFLAAGGDIMKAMQNLEYGQEEIEEFVCILVGLKDQVVFE